MTTPALRLTVLPVGLTPGSLKPKPAASDDASWVIEAQEWLAQTRPDYMTEEEYLAQFVTVMPAGVTVYLGESGPDECSIQLPSDGTVTAKGFPLFRFSNDRYFLTYTDRNMTGLVAQVPGDEQELRHLWPRCEMVQTQYGNVRVLDLGNTHASGVLVVGDLTIIFEMEHPFDSVSLQGWLEADAIPPIRREWLEAKNIQETARVAQAAAEAETRKAEMTQALEDAVRAADAELEPPHEEGVEVEPLPAAGRNEADEMTDTFLAQASEQAVREAQAAINDEAAAIEQLKRITETAHQYELAAVEQRANRTGAPPAEADLGTQLATAETAASTPQPADTDAAPARSATEPAASPGNVEFDPEDDHHPQRCSI